MNIDYQFIIKSLPKIFIYLPVTLELFLVAMIISLIFGTMFAYVNYKKIKGLTWIIKVYMSLIRGTPVLLQLYFCNYILPYLLEQIFKAIGSDYNIYDLNPKYYAFFALSLLSTVSIAEAVRAGLENVDKGQMEAGLAVGMSESKILFNIIFPQAFGNAMPVIGNITVGLVKTTSLAFTLTVVEITAEAKILGGESLRYFEGYLCVFLIYIVVIRVIEIIMKYVEKRINFYRIRKVRV